MGVKQVVLPFERVATREFGRSPSVMLNPGIREWFAEQKSDRMHSETFKFNWLFGKDFDNWKVQFVIHDNATALLFKLTFGGQ